MSSTQPRGSSAGHTRGSQSRGRGRGQATHGFNNTNTPLPLFEPSPFFGPPEATTDSGPWMASSFHLKPEEEQVYEDLDYGAMTCRSLS
jgi:hypothetical protein